MSSSSPTAPIIVPEMQAGGGTTAMHPASRVLSTISAAILPYLKEITSGERQLTSSQLSELKEDRKGSVSEDGKLDFNLFLKYMTSEKSNAMAPTEEVDLSYPISSYFISSSHNTYLSGSQLYGDANTEAYTNV